MKDEGELSDQFLIDAIAGKGMWALERLYDRYGKRFYALAYRMTADHMAAEELVQDAFLAIWQSAKLYAPQAGPVRNWLFSIIYHQTLDYLRSIRRRTALQQIPLQEVEEYERFALSDIQSGSTLSRKSTLSSSVEPPGASSHGKKGAPMVMLTGMPIHGDLREDERPLSADQQN